MPIFSFGGLLYMLAFCVTMCPRRAGAARLAMVLRSPDMLTCYEERFSMLKDAVMMKRK